MLIVDIEWDFLVLSVEIDVKSMNGNGIYPEKCRSDSKPGAHMQIYMSTASYIEN